MFFVGLTIPLSFTSLNSLSCSSMSNQECKARPEIINVTVIILYFILLVLKQVNLVAMAIISMIHRQKYVSRCCKRFKR